MKSYFKIFDFVSDEKLKNNLILDFKEVLTCLNRQAYKAAVVLAGGIVEAILINRALTLPPEKKIEVEEKYLEISQRRKKIEEMELSDLIKTLVDLKIITTPQAGRSDILRDYRNMIHLYKKGNRPNKADAIIVKKLLDDLIKEFESSSKPEVSSADMASLFLTHSAWKKKREKPEYGEILKLFYEEKGSVAFEKLLKLPSFKNKPNPSKSLISNLTYLKSNGLCNYDIDSWRGYPINRYENWSMKTNVRSVVGKYLKTIEV